MLSENVIVLLLFQVSFVLGYILGRISSNSSKHVFFQTQPSEDKPLQQSFKNNSSLSKTMFSIDDSKFVTSVDKPLHGGEKPLGSQVSVDDDVSTSVSKLAQLKRGK